MCWKLYCWLCCNWQVLAGIISQRFAIYLYIYLSIYIPTYLSIPTYLYIAIAGPLAYLCTYYLNSTCRSARSAISIYIVI